MAQWEPHFHRHSYGFRPGRSAPQAVREVQANIRAGYGWVADMDLRAFFDRVNHDRPMARLKGRGAEAGLLRLINRYLKAGVSVDGKLTGGCGREEPRGFAAVNIRAIERDTVFGESVSVSPKMLPASEKAGRWKKLWFQDVKIISAG